VLELVPDLGPTPTGDEALPVEGTPTMEAAAPEPTVEAAALAAVPAPEVEEAALAAVPAPEVEEAAAPAPTRVVEAAVPAPTATPAPVEASPTPLRDLFAANQPVPSTQLTPEAAEAPLSQEPSDALLVPSTLEAALDRLMGTAEGKPRAQLIQPAVTLDLSTADPTQSVGTGVLEPQPVAGPRPTAAPLPTVLETPQLVPELAAPAPDVVRVRVDQDLNVEVTREAKGIGVLLEGAVEAVESLRNIGDELRESLEQGGFDLSSFESRHRAESQDAEATTTATSDASDPVDEPAQRVRLGVHLDRIV